MKKSRYTEERVTCVLRQAEGELLLTSSQLIGRPKLEKIGDIIPRE